MSGLTSNKIIHRWHQLCTDVILAHLRDYLGQRDKTFSISEKNALHGLIRFYSDTIQLAYNTVHCKRCRHFQLAMHISVYMNWLN